MTGSLQGRAIDLTAGNAVSLNNVVSNSALQMSTRAGDVALGGTVTSLATATPNAARDVTVSASGALQSASALTVVSDRNVANAGAEQFNGDVTLTSAYGDLTSTGTLQAGGGLKVSAARTVDLGAQSTSSLGDINVTAGRNLTMNCTIVAQGNGAFNVGQEICGSVDIALGLNASRDLG